jgi:virginiamycin A acetyltransferase
MGTKVKIKHWLFLKLQRILEFEKLPIRIMQSSTFLVVGRDSYHNGKLEIRGSGKIKVGSFCAFGRDIKLITSNHDYNYPVMQYSFYKKYFSEKPNKIFVNKNKFSIEIGNDVWLGDNVSVLPNVKLGHGAIVGTGSVVTKDVAPYTIVGGIPAKFINDRFPDTSKKILLASEWWNWDDEKIKKNKDFFFKNFNTNE